MLVASPVHRTCAFFSPRLPCNEECHTDQRNKRLALALQIENPEAREKLGSSSSLYSEFMKEEARKDPNLAQMVHNALEALVLRAREVLGFCEKVA